MNNIENLKDLIIYQSQNNENISVEVLYNEEDFWLTQKSMSKLFNVAENNITYHLQNIFKTEELEQEAVTQKIRVTASDGKKYNTNFYSLDAIIAVGYRVNSKEATDFRIWATKTLKEYIKKGFVVNSEMLKNGPKFGKDYFDELLAKIKEIRASERRFYQKITDIYKECSFDYDKESQTTQEFYKNVQNKLHYAITGMTAPEIIKYDIYTDASFDNQSKIATYAKKNSNFILKWISRNLNKVAHKQTYNMLKRVRKIKNVGNIKEDLLISKNVFCSLLSNYDKNRYLILVYLVDILDGESLIKITQKEVSEKLKINLGIVNKSFGQLIEMKILEKVKNGIYMLLI